MCQTRLERDEFMARIRVTKREPNPHFALFIIIIIFLNSMFNYWFTTVIRVHQIVLLFCILFYDVKINENHMTKVFWCMNGCSTVAVRTWLRYWKQEFMYNSFVSLLVLTSIKDFNKWKHKSELFVHLLVLLLYSILLLIKVDQMCNIQNYL